MEIETWHIYTVVIGWLVFVGLLIIAVFSVGGNSNED